MAPNSIKSPTHPRGTNVTQPHGVPRRARLRGGAVPRGGRPSSTGHAGMRDRAAIMALTFLATLALVLAPLFAGRAHAETGSEYWDYNRMGEYVMYADFFTTTGNKGYCAEYERHGPKGVTYNTWYYTGEATSSLTRADPHALAWLATKLYPIDPSLNGHSPDNPQKASQLAVWMLQGDCSYSGVTVLGVDAVGDGATRNDVSIAANLAREALGYAGKTGPWDRASKIWVSPDNSHQNMLEVLPQGRIAIVKRSANPAVTDKNDCYGLEGASYTIYSDRACTTAVETITTDVAGKATSEPLPAGTYWVKEKGASRGYEVDLNAHEVTVGAGETATLEVSEVPLRYRIPLVLRKVDADGSPVAQGAATLAGATLEVSLYRGSLDAGSLPASPWMRWTVTTGADGTATLDARVVTQGAALDGGSVALPLGTLVVREVTPPEGYEPLPTPLVAHVEQSGTKARVVGLGSWKKVGDVSEQVVRGGLEVRKADSQTGPEAQGDATLAEAVFSVASAGPGPVVVGGKTYQPGEEVLRIKTDAEGVASTGEGVLPYGDYRVTEATPPEGYLPNEEWSVSVEVRGHEVVSLVEDPCEDAVIRGGLALGKVSRETMAHAPQGGATLAGAVLEVTLESTQAVVVDDVTYAPGDVVASLTTDAEGMARTADDALPYGTYSIRETKAPTGYELDEDWSAVVEVRENGHVYDLSSPEDSVADQVMRGGLHFNKVNAETQAVVGPCPFLITSDTTGESHLAVTDENGEFDSERFPHDARTNANDAALVRSDGGTPSADASLLDPEAGVWFAGDLEHEAPPLDDGALPYDSYTVQELRCAANEGLDLVTFRVFVTRDGHVVDRGTVSDDSLPSVGTVLLYEGERQAPADKVTLTDVVTCEGLDRGREYELVGTLHDSETGEQIGEASSVRLTPHSSSEAAEVPLEVDLSGLAGRSVVAFEELWCEGEIVACHADLSSPDQTIPVSDGRKPPEPETPQEPSKPTEPTPQTTPRPTPSPTPKTGDELPGGALLAALAALGTGILFLASRVRRPRPPRRIY